jgi:NDP-sugar pyrophosphorylase family protein
MEEFKVLELDRIGQNFIPVEYLPAGKDEYYHRNEQSLWPENRWRHLRSDEIETLVRNLNSADSWDNILVTDKFVPKNVRNTDFFGLVRIGTIRNVVLEYHDLKMPVGITNSLIISCDIGDDVAIHNVRYLAHYIIGDNSILFNIDEMHTTDHAKFGNGIIKDGEPEDVRIWLDLMNETGSRKVMPFNGMITADAYLWAKYRDDVILQEKLEEITQKRVDPTRGFYGTTGNRCIIKNSRILKDVMIGSDCYIKGANKLKNLTINSSADEPTQIGEGVELVNGIIGFGCRIFYGCKAVRFIIGNNSNLKYGARLLNSFLGDNSTISCCEVLNNLIFSSHEQHHNNSFLVAAVVMGQSNIAAGATLGSNHNSRSNDNEIQAGRGFWPGLCTSLKHSSRFSSYVLLAKSDYPAELNVQLPFSLVSNNISEDRLEIMPAFWWLHNMYALARNKWKYQTRDKRKTKIQHIEFDYLAPDTVEEILTGCRLLEIWTAMASLRKEGKPVDELNENELSKLGHELLSGPKERIAGLEVLGSDVEKSKRKVFIRKVHESYHAYRDMLFYYAVCGIMSYFRENPDADFKKMCIDLNENEHIKEWVNLGGQLIPEREVDILRGDITAGKLRSWEDIHARYDSLWQKYPREKQKHAFGIMCRLYGEDFVSAESCRDALKKGAEIQEYISNQVYLTRKKDFDNPFRKMTFRDSGEMAAVVGDIKDDSFVKLIRKETEEFLNSLETADRQWR